MAPQTPAKVPVTAASIIAKASGASPPQSKAAVGAAVEAAVAAVPASAKTADQILNMLAASQGGEVGAGQKEEQKEKGSHDQRLKNMENLVTQLDARIRDLEAMNFTVVTMPTDHQAPLASLRVTEWYRKEVAANPKGHGHGAAGPLVALAFMKGLCTQGVPLTSDAPLRARYCLMCALTAKLMTMPSDQIALMFRHFYVVEAHAERGGKGHLSRGRRGHSTR